MSGPAREHFEAAALAWAALATGSPEDHDRRITLDASILSPRLTWGTTPADSSA